jgi:ribosomal protein S5
VGKAGDVIGAVRKGVADGKKHLVKVPLTRHSSIPTLSNGRDGAASVLIRPAAPGTGVIAGGSIRTVLELAGIKNVLAKRLGSSNSPQQCTGCHGGLVQSSYSQGDCKRTGNLPRADLLLIRDDSPTRLPQSQQRRSSPQTA